MRENVLDSKAPALPRDMKTFFIIWLGQLVSQLGSGLTSFALGVWIFDKTGQATPFALTVLFGSLPQVFLLPVAGTLADRWNRRRVMILADTGNALVTLAIAILLVWGDLQVWQIYLMAAMGSVFSAFQEPAYSASVTMLVPKKDLGRANGMLQTSQAVTTITTPLIAGILFVAIGLQGIIIIDFVTYFFAIGALIFVHIPQPILKTEDSHQKPSVLGDAAFGWNFLRRRPGLFGLLWYYAMVNFLLNWSGVLLAPMILSRHPASTLGTIQMVFGIGMLAGSVVMSTWGGPKRRIPAVFSFIMLGMVGVIMTGITANPVFIGAGLFLLMFSVPVASGNSQAVFQTKIAPDIQGRVFAIRGMIARSIMPIAFLSAGPLADHVFEPLLREGGLLFNSFIGDLLGTGPGRGIGLMLVLSGLIVIIVSMIFYANPRIRNVEKELPDEIPG